MEVPQNQLDNLKFRVKVLQEAQTNTELQALLKKKCELDIEFFVNMFCWTYDPRLTQSIIPFILYPKQIKLIEWLDSLFERAKQGEKINAVIDKPRDVGATFTVMIWCLYNFLFKDFSARVGSRKEDYVDKRGEPDCLFYKLDFNTDRLPKFILPNGFNAGEHRASMIVKNPENSNTITGESANPNFGRGGRKSAIIFDEHGFWEWAKASWESAGESTNLRISMSTPPDTGRDSYFYKLLKGTKGKIEIFNFDWQDVPSRNEAWYKQQKESKSEDEFAREVLKSFDATTEGKVYANDLRLAKIGKVEYDGNLPLFISWDYGLDGVGMIWWQKDFANNKVYIIDSYNNQDKEISFYLPFVNGVIDSGAFSYTEAEMDIIDRHKKWSRMITHYGDPDVKKTSVKDGESTKDYLFKKGVYMNYKDWGGRTWKDLRDKTKRIFRRLEIDEENNEFLLSCLRNARYPERREGSQSTTIPLKPVHNFTSHLRSSFEYFADNEPERWQTTMERENIQAENEIFSKYDIF